jgi:hypothetical protein
MRKLIKQWLGAMTTIQRNLIPQTALSSGDQIWNLTTTGVEVWDGTAWIPVGGGGGGGFDTATVGKEDFLDPLTWNLDNGGAPVFPLAPDNGSYYAKVLYNATPIFSHDGGVTKFKYVAYYAKQSGSPKGSLAFSNDGIVWTDRQDMTGPAPVPTGYHVEPILVGNEIHMWYWNGVTMGYVPTDMHFAKASVDNCQTFTTDAPCQNGTTPWIFGGGGSPNGGTYGPCQAFHNSNPTNNPADPFSWLYTMYVNTTDGSKEYICLIYSVDGITWDLFGVGPMMPLGAGAAWDNNDVTYCWTWQDVFGEWHMFYSGGQSTPNDGLGYATSDDRIKWTKHPDNPIFAFGSGPWTTRCAQPCVLKKRGNDTKMLLYWTGQNATRGTFVANPLPITRRGLFAFDANNQGKLPNAP